MVKRTRRKQVDPAQASRYLDVARALRSSAEDLASLAETGDAYGNAIAIVKKKDAVSYQGIYFRLSDAKALVARLRSFAQWAEDVYEQRP